MMNDVVVVVVVVACDEIWFLSIRLSLCAEEN